MQGSSSREVNNIGEQNGVLFGLCCPTRRTNRSALVCLLPNKHFCSAICWFASCSDDRFRRHHVGDWYALSACHPLTPEGAVATTAAAATVPAAAATAANIWRSTVRRAWPPPLSPAAPLSRTPEWQPRQPFTHWRCVISPVRHDLVSATRRQATPLGKRTGPPPPACNRRLAV